MKLGYFVGNQYLASESAADRIRENLEQVRTARDAGFDLICAGQHYLSDPYQMPATFPLLARLASEAGDMHLAATVILVPLHNPVDLAESVATMDAATGGRFIFGIGLGYREEEYTAFGIKRGRAGPAHAGVPGDHEGPLDPGQDGVRGEVLPRPARDAQLPADPEASSAHMDGRQP